MMSNLILPPNHSNPVLKANLQAFFQRYPYERSRLEPLLSKPIENGPVVVIDLPACPSKPPLRVALVAGIGSPQFLVDLLNDPVFQADNFQTFVIENNLDSLRQFFQYFDLTQLINAPKVEWMLLHNKESIKPALFRVLKREHVASLMRNVHIIETHVPQPTEVSSFYQELGEIYDETMHHVLHNFGRINDSLDGVRATLLNKDSILNKPGILDIKGAFKQTPALIVGAGPSLDSHLEEIKKNNNKFVVICADAALKPLLKAGVRVDYVTSIERLNDYQKPFFEELLPLETELVAFPVIQPELFNVFPGKARVCYRNYSYFAYFEKSWPKGIIKCGGSTSHLAIRLASWLGCNKIFLLGIDSCYEEKDGKFRSHCSNTGYEEWGQFTEIEEFAKTRRHLPPIKVINTQGDEVTTNITYYQWIKEYAEELAEIGQTSTIINCTPKGLPIEGIAFKPLSEAVANLDDLTIVKPEQGRPAMNRAFDHKDAVSNLDSWLKIANEAEVECDEILKAPEEIDQERFEALLYIYNFKVCVDPLFVAFVIQNCAKEFFEFENEWWALSRDWTMDRKEKVIITKNRFNLFKQVLEQTLAIFKESKDV